LLHPQKAQPGSVLRPISVSPRPCRPARFLEGSAWRGEGNPSQLNRRPGDARLDCLFDERELPCLGWPRGSGSPLANRKGMGLQLLTALLVVHLVGDAALCVIWLLRSNRVASEAKRT
jgi:hypothetical protein